jgi:transcription termination factor NusB
MELVMTDDIYNQPRRSRREIAMDHLARLNFDEKTEAPKSQPDVEHRLMSDEERLAAHDVLWGLNCPIGESEQRMRELGVWVPRGTAHSAGDDSQD